MKVLVAHASRHGATQGIAERIAHVLATAGHDTEVRPVEDAGDLTGYDAFVVGGAVYMFHWLKEMPKFLKRNEKLLAEHPVWLFSSGPLGTDTVDAQGRDVLEVSAAKETAELMTAVNARGHAMFFGAYSRGKPIGIAERFVARMPAARDAMPQGDFRDWEAIEAWAMSIAKELEQAPAPGTAPPPR